LIGESLAQYRVIASIGAGGMGEVFRGRDTRLDRDVAIKVLPAELAVDRERLARFEREAKLLASLNHPNIAHVYGFESATLPDGTTAHFLAMELVEGEDLAERLSRGAIPVDEAIAIAKQIAEGLEEAHDRGIIHRDLKPANIKLTPDGKVKVLDFGLAKALEPERAAGAANSQLSHSPTLSRHATEAGMIMGTAAYMSPEQARGKAVDKRADIWAFGVVFFEMLTGERLFTGETVSDILAAVLTRDLGLGALPATTPTAIRQLLRRCLERSPRNRLHDIADARIVLDEAIQGRSADEPAAVGSPTAVPRSGFGATLPWVAGLALGALIASLAGWGLGLRAVPASSMRFRAVTSFAGVQVQPALSPDGRSVAFVSNRDGNFNIYVGLVSGGNLLQITDGPNVKASPRWSPDGSLLTYSRLNEWGLWDIWQVPGLGGTPRRLILDAADPTWSPDGKSLAYSDHKTRTIWICDATGQQTRQVTRIPAEESWLRDTEPRFSPDGREIAFVTRPGGPYGELRVVDLNSGEVRELTRDKALAQGPAWSPDGRDIYFASSRRGTLNIWKIPARGGTPEQITTGQGNDAQPDVSADGGRMVFSTFRESVNFARLDLTPGPGPRSPTRLTTDPARFQVDPVYSPDGTRLAYFSNLKGVEREGIWTAAADGTGAIQLVQDSRLNIFPRWSPEGSHIIYMSYPPSSSGLGSTAQYRRVPVSGGTPEAIVDGAVDENFDVGTDGRLLFRGPRGQLQTHDPQSGKTVALAASSLSQKGRLTRWSPDGRSFAYIVNPEEEGDSKAGVWVEEPGSPPRQVFRGWVTWYTRGATSGIVLQEGKPDLNSVLWRVGWDGGELRRVAELRMVFSTTNGSSGPRPHDFFDISPDGRSLAFNVQDVLQANIGMLEWNRPLEP